MPCYLLGFLQFSIGLDRTPYSTGAFPTLQLRTSSPADTGYLSTKQPPTTEPLLPKTVTEILNVLLHGFAASHQRPRPNSAKSHMKAWAYYLPDGIQRSSNSIMTDWVASQQRLIAYLGIGYTHHTADSNQATRPIQLDMVTRQNDRVTSMQ